MALKVRKKIPKRKRKLISPFNPVEQSQIVRELKEKTPLQEFIYSCADEVPYLDALREYQLFWCEHPLKSITAAITEPGAEHMEHMTKCEECGLIERKNGRPRYAR